MAEAKTTHTQWTEIESECGDYRAGFIAVFKKYEGQLTDEKDGQGRTVKVTAASFARHMGIAERTFKGWLTKEQDGARRRPDHQTRDADGARKVLREQPGRVAKEIAEAMEDPDVRAAVAEHLSPKASTDMARSHRPDPLEHLTPADRKAREADADRAVQPIKQAMASFTTMGIVQHIEQATEDLRELDSIAGAEAERIEQATLTLQQELEIKRAMAGVQ